MTTSAYNPDERTLLRYLEEFRPFHILNAVEQPFDQAKFHDISRIVKERSLPVDLTSDFYWIVTKHLANVELLNALQKYSTHSLLINKQLKEAADLVELAQKEKWSLALAVKAKNRSVQIEDTTVVNLVMEYLQENLTKLIFEKTDLVREALYKSCIQINQYLQAKGVKTASTRYKVIGYLLIIAKMPLYQISEGRKVLQNLDAEDFDEVAMIDTVKQILNRPSK